MIGNLSETETDELLHTQLIGRIGCYNNGKVYVVPISYVYDGKKIYVHTYGGAKIDSMRSHPEVCFEVDNISDQGNWQSVIAWGKYEEIIAGPARDNAVQLLLERHLPASSSITTHLGSEWPFHSGDLYKVDGIVFSITIDTKTGKFESTTNSPVMHG